MENQIHLWEAIRQMREITAANGCFSIVFMSYDRSRQQSSGVVRVNRARLRPATHKDDNQFADHMLNFLDVDLNLPRRLWQICLMEFNGKRIKAL